VIYEFFRTAGLLSLAAMVARLRGLIVLPILARYLDTTDLGIWAQVTVIVSTILPLIVLGTDNGITRLLPGLESDLQLRRFAGWLIFLLAGTVIAGSLMAAGRYWVARGFFGSGDGFIHYIPLAVAGIFSSLLVASVRKWFQLRNDGRLMASLLIAQAGLGVAAVVIAVALDGGVFNVIFAGILADMVVGAAFLAIIAARDRPGHPDFSVILPALKFGLPMVPAAYAVWGLNWLDRIFLVHYRSFAEIGIYTVAYSLGYAAVEVFANPVWAMYPSLATELHNRDNREHADRLLHATSGAILIVMVPAIAGLWVLGTPIITLIAGPQYEGGAAIMAIVALGYLFLTLSGFTDLALGLVYRQYLGTISIVLAAGLNLLLNFLLIPSLGIMGAALATLAAFLLHFLLSWYLAARHLPLWRDFRSPIKIVIAAAVMAVVIYLLGKTIDVSPLWQVAILVPAGAVSYVILAMVLGVISHEVRDAARTRIAVFLRARQR
jgi:O-antigen/teichoic acid export membrane protein